MIVTIIDAKLISGSFGPLSSLSLVLGSLKRNKPSTYSADRGDLLSLFADGLAVQDGSWSATLCTVSSCCLSSLSL